jgi:ABC-type transport system involved in multi-copper enzyme maturation permease subunit
MLTIYLHELQDQLRSLRFQVSLLVLLLFFVANGVIYTMKMGRDVEETARVTAAVEDQLAEAENLNEAVDHWHRAIGKAVGTEFITEGGFNWFTDVKWINISSGIGMIGGNRARTTNSWMRRFEVVDWTVVVRLVVSFLCVVLAYDAISGDLERGTLRLAMANPISRGSVLLGRMLAQWTSLMVSVAVGAAVSLLILVINGVLMLDGLIAGALLLFLVGTGTYVAFFLLLSMGVSAIMRNSASSLVVMIMAWAVLTVVVPQTAYLVGSSQAQVAEFTDEDAWDRGWQLRQDTEEALARDGIVPREPGAAQVDNYAKERKFAQALADVEKDQSRLMRTDEAVALKQYQAARMVNLLSPGYAYQYSVEAFLGTGLIRRQDFIEQAYRYRESLRQYVRGRDAADDESPHVLYLPDFMSRQPFDADNLPRFDQQPVPMAEAVAHGVVPIIVLVMETALAFFFAFWAFLRMELAGGD